MQDILFLVNTLNNLNSKLISVYLKITNERTKEIEWNLSIGELTLQYTNY
jgi:hypothetical protein